MTHLMLDLCCGLGGVGRAARAAGWKVVGLDISQLVCPEVRGDMRKLPFRKGFAPDLL
jgi:predicted TPR repeat methyltransferase